MLRRRGAQLAFLLSLTFLFWGSGCGGGGGSSRPPGTQSCAGPYPPQATSLYVLPYEVGASFVVGQGNCSSGSHAAGTDAQYAYDFLMPIGTTITAARSGTVIAVEESFLDTDHTNFHENFVDIRHADGTVAAYVHLTSGGALVNVGDMVVQGDVIALSGNSGNSSAPHLHFAVHGCGNCPSTAVTFRNTRAHPNGLLQGQSYTADPFTPDP